MSIRLPPLNALRVFEAAGRHLSFTRAAEELNVTQAAVSHQIKSLEAWLRTPLFKRLNRALMLTEHGQRYLPDVRDALESLEASTNDILQAEENNTFTVSVLASFGAKWLMPRLYRFREQRPDIDVRISADDRIIDFNKDDVDVALRFGQGDWPTLHVERLMTQDFFPVCSPRLATEGPHPLKVPADLKHHTLLHEETVQNWRMWLMAAGLEDIDTRRGPWFSHALFAIQAACDGHGVALGGTPLVDDDLAAGRLVKPFDLTLPSDWAYYFVCPKPVATRPSILAFRDWLMSEADRGQSPL
jgi:LysR family transcriptional regulator, glycine cleavage system transcriptional activator